MIMLWSVHLIFYTCTSYIFVFKLNDDKTKVRRKTPIQELKDLDEKTVYVVSMYNSA